MIGTWQIVNAKQLVGSVSERDAIGARVTVELESMTLMQTVQTGDGYLVKNEPALFFGLGSSRLIRSVHVRWPSGNEQTYENLSPNQRWLLTESDPIPWPTTK